MAYTEANLLDSERIFLLATVDRDFTKKDKKRIYENSENVIEAERMNPTWNTGVAMVHKGISTLYLAVTQKRKKVEDPEREESS